MRESRKGSGCIIPVKFFDNFYRFDLIFSELA